MNETHLLLDQTECMQQTAMLGYDERLGTMLFRAIARHAYQRLYHGPRTASDTCYLETDRTGEESAVISIPNLAAHLSDLPDTPRIGKLLTKVATELTKTLLPTAAVESHSDEDVADVSLVAVGGLSSVAK